MTLLSVLWQTMELYFSLIYKLQHFITIDQLVKGLEFRKMNSQYFFGTDKAVSKLKRV